MATVWVHRWASLSSKEANRFRMDTIARRMRERARPNIAKMDLHQKSSGNIDMKVSKFLGVSGHLKGMPSPAAQHVGGQRRHLLFQLPKKTVQSVRELAEEPLNI